MVVDGFSNDRERLLMGLMWRVMHCQLMKRQDQVRDDLDKDGAEFVVNLICNDDVDTCDLRPGGNRIMTHVMPTVNAKEADEDKKSGDVDDGDTEDDEDERFNAGCNDQMLQMLQI